MNKSPLMLVQRSNNLSVYLKLKEVTDPLIVYINTTSKVYAFIFIISPLNKPAIINFPSGVHVRDLTPLPTKIILLGSIISVFYVENM